MITKEEKIKFIKLYENERWNFNNTLDYYNRLCWSCPKSDCIDCKLKYVIVALTEKVENNRQKQEHNSTNKEDLIKLCDEMKEKAHALLKSFK